VGTDRPVRPNQKATLNSVFNVLCLFRRERSQNIDDFLHDVTAGKDTPVQLNLSRIGPGVSDDRNCLAFI
jgi:hypothetical protein